MHKSLIRSQFQQRSMAVQRAEAALQALVAAYGDEREAAFTGQDRHRLQQQQWRRTIDDLVQAQPPIFNRAALDEIIAAVRPAPAAPAANQGNQAGRAKIQVLSSADPKDWRTWRNHIAMVIEENGYTEVNHDRAKRIIKIHIYGEAEELTRDITYITADEADAAGDDEETYEEFLEILQRKFLPQSAQFLARQVFESSRQKVDETLGRFHARLLSEFNLAYPATADPNTDPHLIRRFMYGLRDGQIQAHVMQGDPGEYAACLQLAEARFAVLSAVASCHRPGGGRITAMEPKEAAKSIANELLAAMDMRTKTSGAEANRRLRRGDWEGKPRFNDGGKKCYICDSPYHLRMNCDREELEKGRRSGSGGGAKGGSGDSSVGAMSNRAKKRMAAEKKKKAAGNKKLTALEGGEADDEVRDAATAMLAALMTNASNDKQ